MLREVSTSHLALGMYVSDLDRPWLGTPFPVQGFYICSEDDIGRLASHCDFVLVDPRRYDARFANGEDDRRAAATLRRESDPVLPARAAEYSDDAPIEEELPAARQALDDGARRLSSFWSRLVERRQVRVAEVRQAVDPMVESLLRNKDALVALMRVQRTDRHTHDHCMAMAVWASLMGRQLGLAPESIKQLALGCSLIDVGMVYLPSELLARSEGLNLAERVILQSHIDYSLTALAEMGADEEELVDIVRWHHERMDGSGYPDALEGRRVPISARIAGVVDSYDSLISPRNAALKYSSFDALTDLQRDSARFQPELVEQFARAVGLFPSGSLVELNSGEVAVVFSQNTGRRLRPKVLLILNADKRPRDTCPVIDLQAQSERALHIARELPQDAYGIDAQEYFL